MVDATWRFCVVVLCVLILIEEVHTHTHTHTNTGAGAVFSGGLLARAPYHTVHDFLRDIPKHSGDGMAFEAAWNVLGVGPTSPGMIMLCTGEGVYTGMLSPPLHHPATQPHSLLVLSPWGTLV